MYVIKGKGACHGGRHCSLWFTIGFEARDMSNPRPGKNMPNTQNIGRVPRLAAGRMKSRMAFGDQQDQQTLH